MMNVCLILMHISFSVPIGMKQEIEIPLARVMFHKLDPHTHPIIIHVTPLEMTSPDPSLEMKSSSHPYPVTELTLSQLHPGSGETPTPSHVY